MAKGKLHELLAVEADLEGRARNIMHETRKVFKDKAALFQGKLRKFKPFDEEDKIEYPDERLELTSTVDEKLTYTSKVIAKYYDAILQKEATNQVAVADLVVDGMVLAAGLPATFLLGMETRLKGVRDVYDQIPTLAIGTAWELDESMGKGVFVTTHPDTVFKTKKTIKSQVLYEAKFPKANEGGQSQAAIIDKWEESINIGQYITTSWSGMVTPLRKSELLDRIDTLLRAVKKARQRANSTEVVKVAIGKSIMDYINS